MSTLPICAAYLHQGALRRPCPMCGAGPNQWWLNPRGQHRRVPCVLRVHSGTRPGPETPPVTSRLGTP